MIVEVPSGTERLAVHLANPPGASGAPPLLVLCHGYPSGALGAEATGRSNPALADRLANGGGRGAAGTFRGCGASTGNFSLRGWLDDVLAVIDQADDFGANRGIWLSGFGTGGGLCLSAAAARPEVIAVATMGAPADFSDWAKHPKRLLQHARDIGVISDPAFPPSLDTWTKELAEVKPVDAAGLVAPRPLLVLHGSEDESVPSFDARVLGDAHGRAELRIIAGAAHDLRHDPRAIAILAGWLDRERHRSRHP